MRFRSTFTSRAGWPVGCGICAYIGARYSGDVAAGLWTALAFVAMAYALGIAMTVRSRTRREISHLQREVDADRAALAIGRRASWVLLTVVDSAGERYTRTLEQLLTDATPEGCDMLWEQPDYAVLFYLDPGWRYEGADHARSS